MTREEIIKSALKFLVLKQTEQGSWGYSDRNENEISWDKVLEWLDKQPCEDSISSQAAIEAMEQRYCDIERVKKRPVTKGEQAIFLDMRGTVRSLPPANSSTDSTTDSTTVETERKTGKWIYDGDNLNDGMCKCSQCLNKVDPSEARYYCSFCGAEMEIQTLKYADNDTAFGGLQSAT